MRKISQNLTSAELAQRVAKLSIHSSQYEMETPNLHKGSHTVKLYMQIYLKTNCTNVYLINSSTRNLI